MDEFAVRTPPPNYEGTVSVASRSGQVKDMEVIVNGRSSRTNGSHFKTPERISIADRSILRDEAFQKMLALERKRAQRSQKPILLTLLELQGQFASEKSRKTLGKILSVLDTTTRDTDVTGWYKDDCVVGVMFTEIGTEERSSILAAITARVTETLREHLTPQQFSQVVISFHVFPPEDFARGILPSSVGSRFFAATVGAEEARRLG